MCQQLTLLARNELRQMVFTCEHGTIHITHQETTICLKYGEFLRFAGWLVEGNLFVLNQSGQWRVQESSDGQVELWLGSGGLHLTITEFFALTDLLCDALERLKSASITRFLSYTVKVDSSLN